MHRYSLASTPSIRTVSPSSGAAGTTLTVTGVGLTGVTNMRFNQGGVRVASTANTFVNSTTATFTVPALPPGLYTLVLVKNNREMSVDPFKVRACHCVCLVAV